MIWRLRFGNKDRGPFCYHFSYHILLAPSSTGYTFILWPSSPDHSGRVSPRFQHGGTREDKIDTCGYSVYRRSTVRTSFPCTMSCHILIHMVAGPEYRHRPDGVCINTPTAHRHIYGPRGNVQKSEMYSIWPRTVDALNTWSATSNEVHGRKRRVLNYAFSENALRGAETFIHDNVDRWLLLLSDRKKVQDGWTVSTNMAEEMTYLVMDILGDLSFGKCFGMKEAGSDLRYVVDLMVGFIAMVNPVSELQSPRGAANRSSTRMRLGLLRGFG
jgi:hypothetical protein